HIQHIWRDIGTQPNPERGQQDLWFSPQVPIFVKYAESQGNNSEPGELSAFQLVERVSPVDITVVANPAQIRPRESKRIDVRLRDVGGNSYTAAGSYVLNITITTLGDLNLAKRTWVQEELRDRRISDSWPPPGRPIAVDPIASEADLDRWLLPKA